MWVPERDAQQRTAASLADGGDDLMAVELEQVVGRRDEPPFRPAGGPAAALELSGGGYVLRIEPDDVDVHRFERLAAQGGRELTARRYADAAALLTRALAEFSGPPLADVTSAPFAAEIVTRLSERRLVVLEDRAAAQLQLGQHAEVVAELEKIRKAGEAIRKLGMRFNAGHALNYFNVQPVAALPGVRELHIGHAIVSRALFVGMREAVREMKALMVRAAR